MYFKKLSNFFLCAALAATSLGLASCSDDDNKGDEPDPGTEVTSAIYVVNNGVQTGNVPGGITVYDLNTGKITDDGFAAANANLSIGDTPQSAIIAGGYMYVAVSESNLIWVLDPTTLQVVKSIVPEAPATTPRELAYDGKKRLRIPLLGPRRRHRRKHQHAHPHNHRWPEPRGPRGGRRQTLRSQLRRTELGSRLRQLLDERHRPERLYRE